MTFTGALEGSTFAGACGIGAAFAGAAFAGAIFEEGEVFDGDFSTILALPAFFFQQSAPLIRVLP